MIRFQIPGMTCGGCARSITNAIQSVDADAKIETDIAARTVTVESRADTASLVEVIKEAGYEAQAA